MEIFNLYFQLGFEHIINAKAFDHILFIVTLCAVYQSSDWKNVLILITAFSIGHSITLALATLNIIIIPVQLIEFLIPLTIFITAIANITYTQVDFSFKLHRFKYFTALAFGLIHGLGFSNYLKMLLGIEENIFTPLLAFNLGLEVGQIIVVSIILLASYIMLKRLNVIKREWNLVLSGSGLGVSVFFMIERSGLF